LSPVSAGVKTLPFTAVGVEAADAELLRGATVIASATSINTAIDFVVFLNIIIIPFLFM
jgi:hypothetical protein